MSSCVFCVLTYCDGIQDLERVFSTYEKAVHYIESYYNEKDSSGQPLLQHIGEVDSSYLYDDFLQVWIERKEVDGE